MRFDDDFRMLISGELVSATETMAVVDPATGQPFAEAPRASPADLHRAIDAARAAFPAWRATPIEKRRAFLLQAADQLQNAAVPLAALFTREQGRPLPFALQEISGSAEWLRAIASLEVPVEVVEDTPVRRVEVHYYPLGVVAGLVPWNFPISIAIWKMGAPLLAGNTLVLKPSPYTPLATLKMAELFADIFPAGVFNVVSGGDDLGPMMTSHPGINKISFTGSTATGKRVMAAASTDLKRLTLELGGNDAAIVMPDVDVDAIAERIFFGAFFNSAQICAATKRLYVHDQVYDALRDRLHAIASQAPIGDGAEQGVMFGPIQNKAQFTRVRALIDDARAAGLVLLEGKQVPEGNGYFVPLTIVDNPPEDISPMAPTGGAKQSGIGVENGLAGLLEHMQTKVVYVPKAATLQA